MLPAHINLDTITVVQLAVTLSYLITVAQLLATVLHNPDIEVEKPRHVGENYHY